MAGTDFENLSEAGEYVLGTLDAAERNSFEARLTRDINLRAEVTAWQKRLAPLDSETADAEPPAETFDKILVRIDAPTNIIQLQRRITLWRNTAAALATLAAALLIFVMTRPPEPILQKGVYIAVLEGNDKTAGFVAAVDIRNRIIAVRSVSAQPQTGHSYELWALGAGRKAPQPIGLIETATRLSANAMGDTPLEDTVFAVSLEPTGGSPTGAPTGPVLFTGKLVPTD
jgi:anti-sigma-K factor RskA